MSFFFCAAASHLAVKGAVVTMTTSMAGLLLLRLLLLLLIAPLTLRAAMAHPNASSAFPTVSLFQPLTQPECSKKEHPKVSTQG